MRAWPRAPQAEAAQATSPAVPGPHAAAVRPDMEGGEEPEPSELFGDLGTLVVEGRMAGGQRGFHEGPHCVLVYPYRQNKHVCDTKNILCQREAELRRYMYLLWRNNIPMSVEVLLCPSCSHGQKRAMAVDATPEPGYLLLEQWTVHMETAMRCHRSSVGARSLLQAVYSYLHFSQLSAWLSRSCGGLPRNVMYRITVPGDAFGTRFVGGAPQLHTFPMAYLAKDRTLVQVSVRALPRVDAVPAIPCGSCATGEDDEPQGACAAPPAADTGTDVWPDEDLRRSIIKSRLHGAMSDSRDSLLGDSLLDPPRSLHKYPKRYQSPSRSGSPSLEAPEHLMFGSRDSSAERKDHRSRDLSRRVITDQCAHPDLAWTQGRATWRSESPASSDGRADHARPCSPSGSRSRSRSRSRSPAASREESPPGRRSPPLSPPAESCEQEGRVVTDAARAATAERWRAKEERLRQTEQPHHAKEGMCAEESQEWTRDWPERQAPRRSRSDSGSVFRLTAEEKQQVVAVLRHAAEPPAYQPPPPPDNPLLSAIERAGLTDARTVRVRTAHLLARASPVWSDQQAARPLLSAGRPADGAHLVRLVRRALSFEQPLQHGATDDRQCADVDPDRTNSAASEQAANGASKRVANDACERLSKSVSEPVSDGHGQSVTTVAGHSPLGDGKSDQVTNGTTALNKKGSRALKSPTLLKRLFKRGEQQDESETSPKEPSVQGAASRASLRRSLDSATSAVFSQQTGLPLSSSPAPHRRGSAFHFDAALTKVKTFSSALNELTDADSADENGSAPGRPLSSSCPAGVISSLLGTFEESVLNGRLGPVRTVEGFAADIGASGSFHPKHVRLPVTVFFYSLSDNEKMVSPYMGHVNLGRKGYHVPKKGTLQVTLFNPHGTVVKMFVVMYDLSTMPPGSQTFLRQRTLYMPVGESPEHPNSQKWLRYLIHLRFATGRTGRVYVHTDMRMIIFRKSDMDAAALHTSSGVAHEMRSFVHMPDNPRFSPRK